MTNAALIAKLASAKEGTREFDVQVGKATGWHGSNWAVGWLPPEVKLTEAEFARHQVMPAFTTSLQAAVDLVPEGWAGGGRLVGEPPYAMELLNTNEDESGFVNSSANTPALALCVAILRAVEAKDG